MTKALELGELANFTSVNVAGNTVTLDTALSMNVDATSVGGNTALTLRTYSSDLAANAYANSVSYTDAKVANLVNAAPSTLDTLNELANALGNDASFSTTVTTGIGNAYTNAYNQAVVLSGNAYSNAASYADTAAATAYSNAVSVANTTSYNQAANAYANATSYSSNASNISTGTLATARLPATANVSTAVNIAANALTVGTAMVVVANGNVGAGAINPDFKLDVAADTPSEPYVTAFFRNTASGASNAYGGIAVGGLYQSHVRFLTGNTNWSGTGANRWQLRLGEGNNAGDRLNIYSWNYSGEVISFNNNGIVSIGDTASSRVANNTKLSIVGDWSSGHSTVKLQSKTANLVGIGLYNNSGTRKGYYIYDNDYIGIVSANIPILISADDNTTNTVVFAANNNVGIGTSAPANKLHVSGGARFDLAGYPIATFNNTNSGTYGLAQFSENGTQRTYFGLGGSAQSFGTYAAYSADGFSLNHDGAGRVTISNRGTSKEIWLCTGAESVSTFPTVVLKDKIMTLPTQPRFYAYGVTGGTYVNNSYWIFPSVKVNNGSHYNTSTGIFTVPTNGAGTYMFFWSNIAGNSNDVFRYYIYVNDASVGDLHNRTDTTETGSGYGHNTDKWAMLNLAAGDTVRIRFWSDGGTASYPGTNDSGNYYPTFGGYLLG